jgi:predicted nucleotidyltransferase/HEPN domain-containing protein
MDSSNMVHQMRGGQSAWHSFAADPDEFVCLTSNPTLPPTPEFASIIAMRTDIDHLPQLQQDELMGVRQTLLAEFAAAISGATQPWKKNGKIQKIILFGSYSRGDWVDEAANGYQSDFDVLVIVSHKDLTDVAEYWYAAEDKIQRDKTIARPVNIIVHTFEEVNQALLRGEYFWADIARDGIALYELPGAELATPRPLTAADAYQMASGYLAEWLPSVDRALATAARQASQGENDRGWRKDAAFTLHQAAERAYTCILLVRTHYVPRSHNLKFLRSLAEDKEPRLVGAWPRASKLDRRRFELVKRAYVEARYSTSYEIGSDDLAAITRSVRSLRDAVEAISTEWLEELRKTAEP